MIGWQQRYDPQQTPSTWSILISFEMLNVKKKRKEREREKLFWQHRRCTKFFFRCSTATSMEALRMQIVLDQRTSQWPTPTIIPHKCLRISLVISSLFWLIWLKKKNKTKKTLQGQSTQIRDFLTSISSICQISNLRGDFPDSTLHFSLDLDV